MINLRGYFGIGIYNPKTAMNVGTLWRTAYQMGAAFIFTIGRRYKQQPSDTYNTTKHIPLYCYLTFDDYLANIPDSCMTVAVEMGGTPIAEFSHPERCIYLLGAEDNGIPASIIVRCQAIIELPSIRRPSYNVAISGAMVMFDRVTKRTTL